MIQEAGVLVVWLLIVPAVFLGALVFGHAIFTLMLRTISPLEIWANKKIEECESRWESEDEEE